MRDNDLGSSVRIPHPDRDGDLRSTRASGVLDALSIGNGYVIHPESFQRGLYPHWGILRSQDGEAFLLTERPFSTGLDVYFRRLPSRVINTLEQEGQGVVVDLGGGRDGTTGREIARRHPRVNVVNLDVVAVDENSGNYSSKQGNLTDIPLPPSSADFVYSHQVLPFLATDKRAVVLDGVGRVLKSSGVAILDVANEGDSSVQEWRSQLEVLEGSGNYAGYLSQKSYGGNFLVLAKNPLSARIASVIQSLS